MKFILLKLLPLTLEILCKSPIKEKRKFINFIVPIICSHEIVNPKNVCNIFVDIKKIIRETKITVFPNFYLFKNSKKFGLLYILYINTLILFVVCVFV